MRQNGVCVCIGVSYTGQFRQHIVEIYNLPAFYFKYLKFIRFMTGFSRLPLC